MYRQRTRDDFTCCGGLQSKVSWSGGDVGLQWAAAGLLALDQQAVSVLRNGQPRVLWAVEVQVANRLM